MFTQTQRYIERQINRDQMKYVSWKMIPAGDVI